MLYDVYLRTPNVADPVRLINPSPLEAVDGEAAIRQAVQDDAQDDGRRTAGRVYTAYKLEGSHQLRTVVRLVDMA